MLTKPVRIIVLTGFLLLRRGAPVCAPVNLLNTKTGGHIGPHPTID